jgi:hypothetical protein
VSVLVDVTTNAHLPTGMPRGPLVVLTWTPPEQLALFVSQNWFADRTPLSVRSGSSGGFSSLLTKSLLFV